MSQWVGEELMKRPESWHLSPKEGKGFTTMHSKESLVYHNQNSWPELCFASL